MIITCYQLSSIEALVIWKTLLDKKPIVNLFEKYNYCYDGTYYNDQLNFIDNFISNLSLWYINKESIINQNELVGDAMTCRGLLRRYIGDNNLRLDMFGEKNVHSNSFIEAHKFNFRKIISMAQVISYE